VVYDGGTLCLSSKPDICRPPAIDDAVRIFVNGVEVFYEESYTHDFGPVDFSGYLSTGNNTVRVQLIDLLGPTRGGSALWLVPGGEICADDPLETDNSPRDAKPMIPGQQQQHVLCPEDEDWIKVEANTSQRITYLFQVSSPQFTATVSLRDMNGNILKGVDNEDISRASRWNDLSGRIVWMAEIGQISYLKIESTDPSTDRVEYIAELQKQRTQVVPDRDRDAPWGPSSVTVPEFSFLDSGNMLLQQRFSWDQQHMTEFQSQDRYFQYEFNRKGEKKQGPHDYFDYIWSSYRTNLPNPTDCWSEEYITLIPPGSAICLQLTASGGGDEEFEVKSRAAPTALNAGEVYYVSAMFQRVPGTGDNIVFQYGTEGEVCSTWLFCLSLSPTGYYFEFTYLIRGWMRP